MLRIRRAALICLAAGAACVAETAVQGAVPFEFVRNQILLQTRIGAQGPFSCTVDTGANPSVIDLALARSLGLSVSEEAKSAEGVGTEEVAIHQTEFEVHVGDQAPVIIAAVALDLSSLSGAFGRPLHCVLGQSWLDGRVVQIDYAARELHFGAEAARPPSGLECAESEMTFWMPDDLMPLVAVRVNGVELPVSLDTGSSGTLKLFPDGAGKADITAPPAAPEDAVTGARGSASVTRITVESLELGPLVAEAMQGTVGERNIGEPPGRAGNLGNGFLQGGVLTLDYAARRIRLCARH